MSWKLWLWPAPAGKCEQIAATATVTTNGPYITLYARDAFGFSPSQINLLFAFGHFFVTLFSLFGGRLIEAKGTRWSMATGLIAGLGLILVWLLVPVYAASVAVFILVLLAMQVGIIGWDTVRTEGVSTKVLGRALGAVGTVTGFVGAFGAPLASWLVGLTGPTAPFWLALSVGLAAVASVLWSGQDVTATPPPNLTESAMGKVIE